MMKTILFPKSVFASPKKKKKKKNVTICIEHKSKNCLMSNFVVNGSYNKVVQVNTKRNKITND